LPDINVDVVRGVFGVRSGFHFLGSEYNPT
jgi:hypothetical protein